jgi:hypothetical protein
MELLLIGVTLALVAATALLARLAVRLASRP